MWVNLDLILDACLTQDPESKVSIETLSKSNIFLLFVELTTPANINIDQIVHEIIKEIDETIFKEIKKNIIQKVILKC